MPSETSNTAPSWGEVFLQRHPKWMKYLGSWAARATTRSGHPTAPETAIRAEPGALMPELAVDALDLVAAGAQLIEPGQEAIAMLNLPDVQGKRPPVLGAELRGGVVVGLVFAPRGIEPASIIYLQHYLDYRDSLAVFQAAVLEQPPGSLREAVIIVPGEEVNEIDKHFVRPHERDSILLLHKTATQLSATKAGPSPSVYVGVYVDRPGVQPGAKVLMSPPGRYESVIRVAGSFSQEHVDY